MAKKLKVEVNKECSYRDVCVTLDHVLTTVGNRLGETFGDTVYYPAITSYGTPNNSGILAAEASRLSLNVALQLEGDVTGRAMFNGSEGTTPGVVFPTMINKIKGVSVDDIIDDDGYVKRARILGDVEINPLGTKILIGGIADKELGDIFNYDDSDNLCIVKSLTTNNFDTLRYISIEGDGIGGLRTYDAGIVSNGSLIEDYGDPETLPLSKYSFLEFNAQYDEYETELNNWGYCWLNPVTNRKEMVYPITPAISDHLNAVQYFYHPINDSIFGEKLKENSSVTILPSNDFDGGKINKDIYEQFKSMNLLDYVYTDGTGTPHLEIRSYCNIIPEPITVRIRRFGVVNKV